MDIRFPIGALFTCIGALLVAYGIVGDRAAYARSLGYNVNLWWGLVLTAFGIVFVFFGRRAMRRGRVGPPAGH